MQTKKLEKISVEKPIKPMENRVKMRAKGFERCVATIIE